jgi:hypothetical protein
MASPQWTGLCVALPKKPWFRSEFARLNRHRSNPAFGVPKMWIEIIGGPKPLWLKEDDCFDKDGNSCSGTVDADWNPKPTPTPEWLTAPENSHIRRSIDFGSRMESRSMQATMDEVLGFYEDRVTRAGLTVTPTLKVAGPSGSTAHFPRAGSGFYAVSDDYHFGIDIWKHAGTSFWTIQHHAKSPRITQFKEPPKLPAYREDLELRRIPHKTKPGAYYLESGDYKLQFVGATTDRVDLTHEDSGEKYWAHKSALFDAKPLIPRRDPPKEELISWSSLPEWVQFDLDPESKGSMYVNLDEEGREVWRASTTVRFDGCWRCLFEFCLDFLDSHGFDPTGIEHPDHSYFVTILQGGASLALHAQHENGDGIGLTSLNTLGHMTLHINYEPVRGAYKPNAISGEDARHHSAKLRRSFKHE